MSDKRGRNYTDIGMKVIHFKCCHVVKETGLKEETCPVNIGTFLCFG